MHATVFFHYSAIVSMLLVLVRVRLGDALVGHHHKRTHHRPVPEPPSQKIATALDEIINPPVRLPCRHHGRHNMLSGDQAAVGRQTDRCTAASRDDAAAGRGGGEHQPQPVCKSVGCTLRRPPLKACCTVKPICKIATPCRKPMKLRKCRLKSTKKPAACEKPCDLFADICPLSDENCLRLNCEPNKSPLFFSVCSPTCCNLFGSINVPPCCPCACPSACPSACPIACPSACPIACPKACTSLDLTPCPRPCGRACPLSGNTDNAPRPSCCAPPRPPEEVNTFAEKHGCGPSAAEGKRDQPGYPSGWPIGDRVAATGGNHPHRLGEPMLAPMKDLQFGWQYHPSYVATAVTGNSRQHTDSSARRPLGEPMLAMGGGRRPMGDAMSAIARRHAGDRDCRQPMGGPSAATWASRRRDVDDDASVRRSRFVTEFGANVESALAAGGSEGKEGGGQCTAACRANVVAMLKSLRSGVAQEMETNGGLQDSGGSAGQHPTFADAYPLPSEQRRRATASVPPWAASPSTSVGRRRRGRQRAEKCRTRTWGGDGRRRGDR